MSQADAHIDLAAIDSAVHGPVRLAALTALCVHGPMTFTDLRKQLDVTDGALGAHLRKLEEVGYIGFAKEFVGRRPRTTYRISDLGGKALRDYVAAMKAVIDLVEQSQTGESVKGKPGRGGQLLAWAVALLLPTAVDAAHTVSGTVADTAGVPLTEVVVQVEGTYTGTITNARGEFRLALAESPVVLLASQLGYASERVVIADSLVSDVDLRLRPAPIAMAVTEVTWSDPSAKIMAKALARKRWQRAQIQSYRVEAYSRMTLDNDGGIVAVVESLSEVFQADQHGMKELVRSRRLTRNLNADHLLGSVATTDIFRDCSDDELTVLGSNLPGPMHHRALSLYEFRYVGLDSLDGRSIHRLAFEPRGHLQPAFRGTLAVVDSQWAIAEIAMTPNRVATALPSPALRHIDASFRQRYRAFPGAQNPEEELWLPVDFRAAAHLEIGMPGLSFPDMHQVGVTRLTNYRINAPMPDSLKEGERCREQPSARSDSLLAIHPGTVTPTPAEELAMATVDSALTLHRAFAPSGPLARFATLDPEGRRQERGRAGAVRERLALGFNRVDGITLGAREELTLRGVRMRTQLSYSAAAEYWSGSHRVFWPRKGETGCSAWVQIHRETTPRWSSANFDQDMVSLTAALGKRDYFDYFRREGLEAGVAGVLREDGSGVTAAFTAERHRSLPRVTDWALGGDVTRRDNPRIEDGTYRSVRGEANIGGRRSRWGVLGQRRLALSMETSSDWMGSDLSFTKWAVEADWYQPVLLKRRLMPASLRVRTVASTAVGDLPPQRTSVLDVPLAGFSPFGSMRSLAGRPPEGDRLAALFCELDLRSLPFEVLRLGPLHRRGFGLIVHGAVGRTWMAQDSPAWEAVAPHEPERLHREAGASLILFHAYRLDGSWSLRSQRWRIGFSVAPLPIDLAGNGDD